MKNKGGFSLATIVLFVIRLFCNSATTVLFGIQIFSYSATILLFVIQLFCYSATILLFAIQYRGAVLFSQNRTRAFKNGNCTK